MAGQPRTNSPPVSSASRGRLSAAAGVAQQVARPGGSARPGRVGKDLGHRLGPVQFPGPLGFPGQHGQGGAECDPGLHLGKVFTGTFRPLHLGEGASARGLRPAGEELAPGRQDRCLIGETVEHPQYALRPVHAQREFRTCRAHFMIRPLVPERGDDRLGAVQEYLGA